MVLRCFLSNERRGPFFGPAAILVVVGDGVDLPQLAGPETTCPEETALFLPFASLVISFSKKSFSGSSTWSGARLQYGFPLRCGSINPSAKQVDGLLIAFLGCRRKCVSGRRLWCCSGGDDLHNRRSTETNGSFVHGFEKGLL